MREKIKDDDQITVLKELFEEHKDFCLDQHNQVQGHNPTDCFLDWVREKIEE